MLKTRALSRNIFRRAATAICGAIAAHWFDGCDARNPGRERPIHGPHDV
jgi:hypothetical protein